MVEFTGTTHIDIDEQVECPLCSGAQRINITLDTKYGDISIEGCPSSRLTCPLCNGEGNIYINIPDYEAEVTIDVDPPDRN